MTTFGKVAERAVQGPPADASERTAAAQRGSHCPIPLGGGRLSVFLDLFNAYNRHNAWAYALVPQRIVGDEIVYRREAEAVGLLPTLGARWEF